MKYANYLILLVLLLSAFLLRDSLHISTNILSLFAPKESLENLKIANQLGYSKEMFVAIKGYDSKAKNELKTVANSLKKLSEIQRVSYTLAPTQEIQDYFQKYHRLRADFNTTLLSRQEIQSKLHTLYKAQEQSFFYTPINTSDPLSLFTSQKQQSVPHRGKYLSLKNYGYLIKVTTKIDPSQMDKARVLYTKLQSILKNNPNTLIFTPFFYSVENSQKIKADVQYIVAFSTIILLIIYFVMLRDIKLLAQSVTTLLSSMLFATLICTSTQENFGVLSLAFGTSLSAVSIDYFFHYYFHGFYQGKKKLNKSVFYGYITTASAFGVFSFIPVQLISQISLFALLSLSFAYLVFTFIFPYLDIKPHTKVLQTPSKKLRLSPLSITLASLALLLYAGTSLKFDSNIRHLDYQNIPLQKAQKLFQGANTDHLLGVLVQANTKEELLERLEEIKNTQEVSFSFANFIPSSKEYQKRKAELQDYDFKDLNAKVNEVASAIGFKKGYFKEAYLFGVTPSLEDIDLSLFESLGLYLTQKGNKLYTIAMVQDIQATQGIQGVSPIDVKTLFANVAQQMLKGILLYGTVVLLLVFTLLLLSVRSKILYALNYILFPLSLTLLVISLFFELNILHLFACIILIAIGIDYGIYMSKSQMQSNTIISIKYSLLSTFAAFGVLLFSSVSALFSIGLVITIGTGSIYLLTRIMR